MAWFHRTSDYEATIRENVVGFSDSEAVEVLASASGGFIFNRDPDGFFETPRLNNIDAGICLSNLNDNLVVEL